MSLRMASTNSWFDTFLFWGSLFLPFCAIIVSYFDIGDSFQNIMLGIVIMFVGLMLWVTRLWE